jgi:hypothetical protein
MPSPATVVQKAPIEELCGQLVGVRVATLGPLLGHTDRRHTIRPADGQLDGQAAGEEEDQAAGKAVPGPHGVHHLHVAALRGQGEVLTEVVRDVHGSLAA